MGVDGEDLRLAPEEPQTSLTSCLFLPVQAVLEVCDRTGSVCVVLWNSVCLSWYRCLKPGDVISLRRYRVKRRYQAGTHDVGTMLLV